jgi:predicted site-specific integrase-resolvase
MAAIDEISGRITLTKAAKIMGVTATTVRRHIAAGRIHVDMWEDRLMLDKGDVERLRDTDRKPGRPHKSEE